MVRRSPDKNVSRWSKHTSYPTAGTVKTRTPSELNTSARVNNKLAEHELDASRHRIDTIQRKSIHLLDSQKKLLEKSMLAYSEKMKEINNSKTNELFREIHTRNASRNDMRIKSPTSVSGRSNSSLPARIQPAIHVRQRRSYCESLKGFKQVNIPTPIPEASSRGSTAEVRLSLNKISSPVSKQGSATIVNARMRKTASVRNASRVKKTQSLDGDNMSVNIMPTYTTEVSHKVAPRIVNNSLPWMVDADGSGSDSAYSSASEDLDSDAVSPRDLKSRLANEENIAQESQYVLTIPKIHVRSRKIKSHSVGQLKINNDLHRQVVLNQARTSR